ncbi:MAG: hemerythrin domain-containing protein [Clostridia bacterium]|nr:hemerythrin domain-containing protein [Clostridia bacterium]
MEKYLNTTIKEVITEYPEIGGLLQEFEVGCVTCTLGTCLVKDIIDIHNLSKEQEVVIMARMEKIIYPERDIDIPEFKDGGRGYKQLKYSPPVKALVNEHARIKSFIGLIPKICRIVETNPEMGRPLVLESINFIRNYADRFHHAKEEDILFKYTDENFDIIRVMLEDHTTARGIVRAILDALQDGDSAAITKALTGYGHLLTEHIAKEDEVLYPWINRNLTIRQIDELAEKFNSVEESFGNDIEEKADKFIESLRKIV